MSLIKIKSIFVLIFVSHSPDKKFVGLLVLLRFLFGIGIGLMLLGTNEIFDKPPRFEEALVSSGNLIATSGGRVKSAGFRKIVVETEEGNFEFRSYSLKKTKSLKNKLGDQITIWSYPYRDAFFIKRNKVIEIEIDGARVLNDWEVVRTRTLNNNFANLLWWGVAITLLSLWLLYKLAASQRLNN